LVNLSSNPSGEFEVGHKHIKRLAKAIVDYLVWLNVTENPKRFRESYHHILVEFLIFALQKKIRWKDMFSLETVRIFGQHSADLADAVDVLTGLSDYLYEEGEIPEPLEVPNRQIILPETYERYLRYLQKGKVVSKPLVRSSRRVLASLNEYLEQQNIALKVLNIKHIDGFLAEFNKPFCNVTRGTYRSHIRNFLKYLHDQKVTQTDIAHLLVGPRMFGDPKPPRFLRPEEVKKLFESISLDSPAKIRTYAMLFLSYSLGLRPIEIKRITLDDISFQRAALTISERKTKNPVVMNLPEKTLKAIALYVHKVRPESRYRDLFLSLDKPHRPVCSNTVSGQISNAMKSAGLSASAYWLRHTYAQRLLHIGYSIYDIKEMMGHQSIRSTQRYLHVNTEHMRKVLFNETL
jgi:site-specific recombinase XerD